MLKAAASIDTRCGQAFSQAAKRAASIFKMMDVSRHRSVDTLPMCETPSFSRIMPGAGLQ